MAWAEDHHRRLLLICSIVAALCVAAFFPVADFEFTSYDDDVYVTDNPRVQAGLSLASVRWAFAAGGYASNWHPLTWISHMLDVELYGMRAGMHHLTNVGMHAAAAVLLFLFLVAATGARGASALVACLFGLHPLHVESVAWVSERKDVLSAIFWMTTLLAYVRYVRAPGPGRYLAVVVSFALGLMAKSMLITLPCVLLLLDYWPLGRLAGPPDPAAGGKRSAGFVRLLLEKAPLFVLSGVSGAITFAVQDRSGSISFTGWQHFDFRVANVLLSYGHHLIKTFWPRDLAVFYPYAGKLPPLWKPAVAGLALVVVSAGAVWWRRRLPFFVVGWLWFLGTLVPVIGFVQVGLQSRADRYSYLPLVGVFVAAVWVVSGALSRPGWRRTAAGVAAIVVLSSLLAATLSQVRHWRDSGTLFTRAVAVAPDSFVAHDNLGAFLLRQGRHEDAVSHFTSSLQINPYDHVAWFNLGLACCRQGRGEEARGYFARALGINGALWTLYARLGQPCSSGR